MKSVILSVKSTRNYFHFETIFGTFYASTGNTKVAVPIISAGTGLDCPNASICPFHVDNYKASGFPMCYACKAEKLYPSVKKSRDRNEFILKEVHKLGDWESIEFGRQVAETITKHCHKHAIKYVRLNESSDLADWNIDFFVGMTEKFKSNKIITYTYSKSSTSLVNRLEAYGAAVMISEQDFVVVKTEQEAKDRGLVLCPGVGCGAACLRCPKKLKSAVLKH